MARSKQTKRYPWNPVSEKNSQAGRVEVETRYNTGRWRTTSRLFLEENPLCVVSQDQGLIVPAKVTDHIQPVRFGGDFWDANNYQALSSEIHNKKSGFEAQLMRLMSKYELPVRKAIYEKMALEIKLEYEKQMFLIDFQIVTEFYKKWSQRGGMG